jgi:uncharacterized protein YyaL (SSP411 family)
MKKFLLTIIILFSGISLLFAQSEAVNIYNPSADTKADIAAAVAKAQAENKHVLLQVGGNWCPWCIKLHAFMDTVAQIDSVMNADYIRVMVNYSKENKNETVMSDLGHPERFGFPVLIVLNQEGEPIHTQDSWYLEKDKSYDKEKVIHLLEMWNVKAAGK